MNTAHACSFAITIVDKQSSWKGHVDDAERGTRLTEAFAEYIPYHRQ
jgi:hypothetical protein